MKRFNRLRERKRVDAKVTKRNGRSQEPPPKRAASPSARNNLLENPMDVKKRQAAEVKARQAATSVRAIEQERIKQQLRNVAKKQNITYAQAKALYQHYRNVLEPLKPESIAQSLNLEYFDHGQTKLQEDFHEELRDVARKFGESFFSGNHPFPYDGSADKLNRDADRLEFEDYVQGIVQVARQGRPEDRLLILFQVVDRDGDGSISHPELMELLTAHCETEERQDKLYTWVKKHFWEADKDRNGVLDFYECLDILRKHPSVMHNITFNIDAYIDQVKQGSPDASFEPEL